MKSITAQSKSQTISSDKFIMPSWTVANTVHAFSTTRKLPGHSLPPYDSFNLGIHVNDDPAHVQANRKDLTEILHLPSEPLWLRQTHTDICLRSEDYDPNIEADASYTDKPNTVLVIMTADCLPILLTNKAGTEIAAIHAGWQSLGKGIIENTLNQFKSKDLQAWFAPAISQPYYEIGSEVRELYLNYHDYLEAAFEANSQKPGHYFLSLTQAASLVLQENGIDDITNSELCTYADEDLFYSYRRDNVTGRIGTLIYMKPDL